MNSELKARFDGYPAHIKPLMQALRGYILDVAAEHQLGEVEESLKWGEPSYLVKGGSPIRMDWKEKAPDQYCLYFVCTTKLVETFRELYADTLEFQGNRAIVLNIQQSLPTEAIKHCLALAMQYKRLRNKPLLGA